MKTYNGKRVIGSITTFPSLTAYSDLMHGKITREEYSKLDVREKTSFITEDFEIVNINENSRLQSAKNAVVSFFKTIWSKLSHRCCG